MGMVDDSIGFYFSCRDFPLYYYWIHRSGGGENSTKTVCQIRKFARR